MSGDVFVLMIVFGFSTVTVVRSRGASPSISPRSSSQSPSASSVFRLNRIGVRLAGAPLPDVATERSIRGICSFCLSYGNISRTLSLNPTLSPCAGRGPALRGNDPVRRPDIGPVWAPAFSLWLKFILSACLAGSRRAGGRSFRRNRAATPKRPSGEGSGTVGADAGASGVFCLDGFKGAGVRNRHPRLLHRLDVRRVCAGERPEKPLPRPAAKPKAKIAPPRPDPFAR